MMTAFPWFVALFLQAVSTSMVVVFDLGDLRPAPAIIVVAFTAARLDSLAGVLICSAIGLSTDLMSMSPLGLHMLSFTLVFLAGRWLSGLLSLHGPGGAIPLVLSMGLGSRLLVAAFLGLFSDAGARFSSWSTVLGGVAVDLVLAVPLWLLLEFLYLRLLGDLEESWSQGK